MDTFRHSIIDSRSYFDGMVPRIQLAFILLVITYKAGAAFIRMVEAVLGKDAFRKGLQRYLKKHEYSNADHNDLIGAFEDVS